MRRHDEQVFYGGEGKDSIGWDALSRGDHRALSANRHFTQHLLSVAKDATGEGGKGLISRRNGKPDPQRTKLIQENQRLKELVANLSVDNLVLKKRLMGG